MDVGLLTHYETCRLSLDELTTQYFKCSTCVWHICRDVERMFTSRSAVTALPTSSSKLGSYLRGLGELHVSLYSVSPKAVHCLIRLFPIMSDHRYVAVTDVTKYMCVWDQKTCMNEWVHLYMAGKWSDSDNLWLSWRSPVNNEFTLHVLGCVVGCISPRSQSCLPLFELLLVHVLGHAGLAPLVKLKSLYYVITPVYHQ